MIMRRYTSLLSVGCALALLRPFPLCAQVVAAGPSFADRLDGLVDTLMREVGARGAAVALIEGGRVTLERTYGFADAERRMPVTAATTFNAASVTKSLTAWGVMRLVEDGRIGLDDPVFSHVSRWRLPASEWSLEDVTVRRLLSHTAGVNRGTTGIWQLGDTMPTLVAALAGETNGLGDTRLQSRPGTVFSYSGAGYSILQLLIEEVSGQPVERFLRERVLRPLGMRSSEVGWSELTQRTTATAYSELGTAIRPYRSVEVATGALNVTIGDLARFGAAHVGTGRGGGLLRAESVSAMIRAADATDGHWGLGIARQAAPGGRMLIGHEGGNPGWGAVFRVDPETGDGIAVLVNRSWGAEFYYPLLCAWRNATARVAERERCAIPALATISTAIVDSGLARGRARYEQVRRERPLAVSDQAMASLARRFRYSGREADALEVLRWHLENSRGSSRAHELLGDALLAAGRVEEGRERLTEASRLAPADSALREKARRARESGG